MVPLPTSSSLRSGRPCCQDKAVAGRSPEEKPRLDSMLHLGSQGAKDPVKSSKMFLATEREALSCSLPSQLSVS